MELKMIVIGTARGFVVPKDVADVFDFNVGDTFKVKMRKNKIIMTKKKEKKEEDDYSDITDEDIDKVIEEMEEEERSKI